MPCQQAHSHAAVALTGAGRLFWGSTADSIVSCCVLQLCGSAYATLTVLDGSGMGISVEARPINVMHAVLPYGFQEEHCGHQQAVVSSGVGALQ